MLLNDFFNILDKDTQDSQTTAHIRLNAAHSVFDGHFPGNPIVPGVTMIQMVKEILERTIGHSLFLSKTNNAKFTAILNPQKTPEVIVKINAEPIEKKAYKTSATITFEETTFFKFTGKFEESGIISID